MALATLLLVSCSEWALIDRRPVRDDTPAESEDGTDSADASTHSDLRYVGDPPLLEACNGLDDDHDGAVDEGLADHDADGIADCVDRDCTLPPVPSGHIPRRPECQRPSLPTVDEPWAVAVRWRWEGWSEDPAFKQVAALPLVGRLLDVNGDGTVDDRDPPTVVIVAYDAGQVPGAPGRLVFLRGDTGEEVGPTWPGVRTRTGAIGSPHDGWPRLIGWEDQEAIYSWQPSQGATPDVHRFELTNSGPSNLVTTLGRGPTGALLASACRHTLDVADTTLLWSGASCASHYPAHQWTPTAGGVSRWLHGVVVRDELWNETDLAQGLLYGVWTIPIQLDGDSPPEFLVGTGTGILKVDDDRLVASPWSSVRPAGSPCVGDIDGDGRAEVVLSIAFDRVVAFRLDGQVLWEAPASDTTGFATCSLFDFDNDGALDVLFAGEDAFRIYDGRTGEVRFVDWGHSSWTSSEYPIVADIDADGHAEVLVVHNEHRIEGVDPDQRSGITAYAHAGAGWPPADPGWPVWDFNRRLVDYTGALLDTEPPWTQEHNLLRSAPMPDIARPELSIEHVGSCRSGCGQDNPVRVALAVANAGHVDANVVQLAVYADAGGGWVLDHDLALSGLVAGERRGVEITLLPETPDIRYRFRVNDDGTGALSHECDLGNNEVIVDFDACGP